MKILAISLLPFFSQLKVFPVPSIPLVLLRKHVHHRTCLSKMTLFQKLGIQFEPPLVGSFRGLGCGNRIFHRPLFHRFGHESFLLFLLLNSNRQVFHGIAPSTLRYLFSLSFSNAFIDLPTKSQNLRLNKLSERNSLSGELSRNLDNRQLLWIPLHNRHKQRQERDQ